MKGRRVHFVRAASSLGADKPMEEASLLESQSITTIAGHNIGLLNYTG